MENGSGRSAVLLIHGLWFRPEVWTPWLRELDEAGYDAVVLSWTGGGPAADGTRARPVPDLSTVLRAAREHIAALRSRPIVIGHGTGGAVAEWLLNDGDAAAAICLAPVPTGYPAIPTAIRLLCRRTSLALLSLRGGAVVPTFAQFRWTIANGSSDADARRLYETCVAAGSARSVLLRAVRHRVSAGRGQQRRGPLLVVAAGRDKLVREVSTALLYGAHRRRQPDAVTDYKAFPVLDHTLGLGTQTMEVLFYSLDWLTAQDM